MHTSVAPAGSGDTSRTVCSYFVIPGLEYRKILSLSEKRQVLSLQFIQIILDLKQQPRKKSLNIWVDSTENKLNVFFIKNICVAGKYLILWKKKLTEK